MQIQKLEIKSFSKLKNLNLNFSKGINIIYGNNESGKTSVQSFIKGMLYGLKGGRTLRDGSLPPLKRYKPWEGSDYSGVMEFTLDNGEACKVERDFNNNSVKIYDSSFNDISNSFELSRDKGPLFADKYLGVNESCFEKTVFIKQMEAKIDEEAGKELLSRLLNVSQTGFEDISLTKAQEALREAQKTYVGTDKTSTRPLDRLIARLEELKSLRNRAVEKREKSFGIEHNLIEANKVKDSLEERKSLLVLAKDILEEKKEFDTVEKKKLELDQLQSNIQNAEQERSTILKRILEINTVKKQLEKFSSYSEEDLDALNIAYHRMMSLENESQRLLQELQKKQQSVQRYKGQLGELKAFEAIEENSESHVLTLSKELEHLKLEKEKNNIDVLEEKIKAATSKDRFSKVKLAVSVTLLVCSGLLWFDYPLASYFAGALFLVITAYAVSSKRKCTAELEDLLNIKKVAFVFSNGVVEEIEKKQRLLDDILRKACVEGVEDFFKLKAEFDSLSKAIKELEQEIRYLEAEKAANANKLDEIKHSLGHMFMEAGIISSESDPIKEAHVSEFKNSVRRFCGLDPSVKYVMHRVEDLDSLLAAAYSKASALCGSECRALADIKEYVGELCVKLKALEEKFNSELSHFEQECNDKGVSIKGLEDLSNKFARMSISELESIISFNYNNCSEELSSVQLEIKEYETLLKSLEINDSDIQNIDREIEELEIRKNELGDLSICLTTAIDLLTEAGTEIQRDFAPLLNQKMSRIIGRITSDRYKDLRADNRLMLKTVSEETGDVVSAASLSGGTVDQVYLSLRLAMAEMIASDGETLPLVMDEVFAQYDDTRTRETMNYFKELGESRQVLLFTCKSREIGIAKEVFGDSVNVIELVNQKD